MTASMNTSRVEGIESTWLDDGEKRRLEGEFRSAMDETAARQEWDVSADVTVKLSSARPPALTLN